MRAAPVLVEVLVIARPLLVVVVVSLAALPAVAMSPKEAAQAAAMMHRPMPSFIERPELPTRMEAIAGRLPIFLNRHGGTYTCGNDNGAHNISSVACGQNNDQPSGTVGAFSGSDADWTDVMACVTDQFSRFNVTITDQQPANGSTFV
ncbi:MAG TPA: hypothetical protein VGO62_12960, partial [Myxococcota bacterium]